MLSVLDEYEAKIKAKENAKVIGANGLSEMHVRSLKRQQLEEASRHDCYLVNVVALSIDEIRKRPEGAKCQFHCGHYNSASQQVVLNLKKPSAP